jgi:hypothetical protein
VAVLVDDLAVGAERGSEPVHRILARRLDRLGDAGRERVEDTDDDGQEQIVLAAEVAVDQPDADARFGGDGLHRHRLRAVALHEPCRSTEQLGAALLGPGPASRLVRVDVGGRGQGISRCDGLGERRFILRPGGDGQRHHRLQHRPSV